MAIIEFNPLRRIRGLQERLSGTALDAAVLFYSKSLYYYTGTTQPGFLVVGPDDYRLLVNKGMEHVPGETWLPPEKVAKGNFEAIVRTLEEWKIQGGALGMEIDVIPAALYLKAAKVLPRFKIADVSRLVLDQRKVKDREELSRIREACRILHQGHDRILAVLREGMTEMDLSAEIEDAHRRAGHEGQYFSRQFDFFMGRGVLASGENLSRIAGKVQSISGMGLSSALPLGASARVLKKGDMVVVDIPTLYRGYHSDQSRTYAVGSAPVSCRDLYRALREIADRTVECLKPGVSSEELYDKAFAFSREIGMEKYFMLLGGNPEPLSFIGHGVGLEVNEMPLVSRGNKDPIPEGAVLTLEMEMWKSDCEVVKLEDTIAVRAEGAEILTMTPRDLFEV